MERKRAAATIRVLLADFSIAKRLNMITHGKYADALMISECPAQILAMKYPERPKEKADTIPDSMPCLRYRRLRKYIPVMANRMCPIVRTVQAVVTGKTTYRRFGGYRNATEGLARNGVPEKRYGFHQGMTPLLSSAAIN
jgi:hypothetical protein